MKTIACVFVWVIAHVIFSPAIASDSGEAKAWTSWQINNPAGAGLLAAASLGMWPRSFGNDLRPAGMYYVEAISDGSLPYTKTHAERSFRRWRAIGFSFEVLLLGWLTWNLGYRRRVLRANTPVSA